METVMKKLCLIALAALSAAPAEAETAREVRSVRVGYSDLDLRSPEGAAKFHRRIRSAVADACGTASDADLRGKNEARRCRAETMIAASAQVRTADALRQGRAAPTASLVQNGAGRR